METAPNISPGTNPKLAQPWKTSLENVRVEKKKELSQSEPSREVSILSQLERYAHNNAFENFVSLAESADWTKQSAHTIRGSVDLALMLDMNRLAVRLARKGAGIFPDDPYIRKIVRILRKPSIQGTAPASDRKLDASREWLRRHACQYKGKWVAVQAGNLIGAANSARELKNAISSLFHSKDTLILKVM